MSRLFAIAAVITLCALLTGCGGGGPSLVSPFAGSRSGTVTDPADNSVAALTMVTQSDGSWTGVLSENNQDTALTGTINSAGICSATSSFAPGEIVNWHGTLALQSEHLKGTLIIEYEGTVVGSIVVDLHSSP